MVAANLRRYDPKNRTAMFKNRFFCGLAAGLALLPASASIGRNTNSDASRVDVYDGFETPELSQIWSTDRFAPGAVTMQAEVVRAGHGAAKITVHPRDKFHAGVNDRKDSERAELREAQKLMSKENVAYEYSFSEFVPTNFPIVPVRLVLAQWKQDCPEGGNCVNDSPVVAVRYVSGALRITRQIGAHPSTLFETRDELRGKWVDFKFQIRFATSEAGRIKAWLNGKQVVDYSGPTAYPENTKTSYPSPSYFYFKMGLYRDAMAETMTIYIDEYRKKQLPDGAL